MQHTEADAVSTRRIVGAVKIGERVFVEHDEHALAAVLRPEDLDRLKAAGVIAGDWSDAAAPGDVHPADHDDANGDGDDAAPDTSARTRTPAPAPPPPTKPAPPPPAPVKAPPKAPPPAPAPAPAPARAHRRK